MSAGPRTGPPRPRWPRLWPPLVAGLLAAAAAFIALGPLTGDDGDQQRVGPEPPAAPDAVAAGRAVFARMGCGGCHRLAAARSEGRIGPNLDQRLPAHTRESLTSAIVAPPASGSFYVMPDDYGERLSADELDDLVSFLLDAGARSDPN